LGGIVASSNVAYVEPNVELYSEHFVLILHHRSIFGDNVIKHLDA